MNNNSRTKNSALSMLASSTYYFTFIILGLINRKMLISIMGIEYQGINGLFSSILAILGVTELGLGTAIIYHLYKPLADNNQILVGTIMQFYKKCFSWIAVLMLFVGVVISLKLDFFVDNSDLPVNLHLVFYLILADVVATYTFSYKRSILYADQKNYVIANINTIFVISYNIVQIAVLYITKDYYYYLAARLAFRLLENVAINYVVDKQYPYLNNKYPSLDKNILGDIILKIKGLLFHKISTFIVNGTDNILISKFLGLTIVGVYSNYLYIINSLNAVLQQAFDGITGSVGNLIVKTEDERKMLVFKELNCINIFLSSMFVNLMVVLSSPFISFFFGIEYVMDDFVVIILGLNMIMTNQRRVFGMFKSAAGIQYEDRYVPLVESIVNILFSLILLHYLGFVGVILGTLISQICDFSYTFPIFVYRNTLGGYKLSYVKYLISVLLFQILSLGVCFSGCLLVTYNGVIALVVKSLLVIVLSTITFIVFFRNSEDFISLRNRLQLSNTLIKWIKK